MPGIKMGHDSMSSLVNDGSVQLINKADSPSVAAVIATVVTAAAAVTATATTTGITVATAAAAATIATPVIGGAVVGGRVGGAAIVAPVIAAATTPVIGAAAACVAVATTLRVALARDLTGPGAVAAAQRRSGSARLGLAHGHSPSAGDLTTVQLLGDACRPDKEGRVCPVPVVLAEM